MSEFFQAVGRLAERRIGQRATLTRCGLFCWRWEVTGTAGRTFTQSGARRAIRRAVRHSAPVVDTAMRPAA